MTDKKWDGTRTVTLDSAPDEMERIGSHLFTAAVPFDADPEFKAYIMAAGTTHAMGNRSIDNILRRHCDKWIKHFEEQELSDAKGLVGLRRAIVRQATARCVEISNLDLGADALSGTTAAANVLIRLDSSFRAASQLLQLGFAFESEAVIRLGFEQVAWSNVARHLHLSKEVTKVSGTGNITKLKEIFLGAGFIYGRLSEMAHISPRTHARFLVEANGEMMIRIKAPGAARESLRLLLVLLDAFLVVGELSFKHAGIACQSIDPNTGNLKGKRPVRELIAEFERILPRGTRGFFDSWWK